MSTGRACWLSLAFLTVAGCATPYQSGGLSGGYSEKKINDSAYVVSFNGNGFASKDRVYYFWMYRCAELTLKNGYALFYIKPNEANAPKAANTPLPHFYSDETNHRGQDHSDMVQVRGGGTTYHYTYIPGTTTTSTKWNYSGTVLMFAKPLPQEELYALDARTIVDELKPCVTANGTSAEPLRGEMIRHAFIAHARIDYGHDMRIVAGPPPTTVTEGAPPAVGNPRTAGAIQAKIDLSQIYFYDAFQMHMEHARDKVGGRLTLGFTITPNGAVKECHAAANNFTDTMFVNTMLNVCRHFQFGPDNVLETNVNYPMEFTPVS
jgi:hypothetical protein